jgi:hypothetical protein
MTETPFVVKRGEVQGRPAVGYNRSNHPGWYNELKNGNKL